MGVCVFLVVVFEVEGLLVFGDFVFYDDYLLKIKRVYNNVMDFFEVLWNVEEIVYKEFYFFFIWIEEVFDDEGLCMILVVSLIFLF